MADVKYCTEYFTYINHLSPDRPASLRGVNPEGSHLFNHAGPQPVVSTGGQAGTVELSASVNFLGRVSPPPVAVYREDEEDHVSDDSTSEYNWHSYCSCLHMLIALTIYSVQIILNWFSLGALFC